MRMESSTSKVSQLKLHSRFSLKNLATMTQTSKELKMLLRALRLIINTYKRSMSLLQLLISLVRERPCLLSTRGSLAKTRILFSLRELPRESLRNAPPTRRLMDQRASSQLMTRNS